MWSFGVLDLGLFGGKANMCWNFNGGGSFCGEIFGVGGYIIEVGGSGLEVAQRVDFVGLVVVGRGWVAYPNFFLENISIFGNYPHFSA